jgi:hypothetical protein
MRSNQPVIRWTCDHNGRCRFLLLNQKFDRLYKDVIDVRAYYRNGVIDFTSSRLSKIFKEFIALTEKRVNNRKVYAVDLS